MIGISHFLSLAHTSGISIHFANGQRVRRALSHLGGATARSSRRVEEGCITTTSTTTTTTTTPSWGQAPPDGPHVGPLE